MPWYHLGVKVLLIAMCCAILLRIIIYPLSIWFTGKYKDTRVHKWSDRWTIFFTICIILQDSFLIFIVLLFANIKIFSYFEVLFFLSAVAVMEVVDGSIPIVFPMTSAHEEKKYGIGLIWSSLGIGSFVLSKITMVILLRYCAILMLLIGIVFLIRSLRGQIQVERRGNC